MGSSPNPLPPIVRYSEQNEQNELDDIRNYSQEPPLNFSLKDPSVIKYIEDGFANIEKFSKLLKVGFSTCLHDELKNALLYNDKGNLNFILEIALRISKNEIFPIELSNYFNLSAILFDYLKEKLQPIYISILAENNIQKPIEILKSNIDLKKLEINLSSSLKNMDNTFNINIEGKIKSGFYYLLGISLSDILTLEKVFKIIQNLIFNNVKEIINQINNRPLILILFLFLFDKIEINNILMNISKDIEIEMKFSMSTEFLKLTALQLFENFCHLLSPVHALSNLKYLFDILKRHIPDGEPIMKILTGFLIKFPAVKLGNDYKIGEYFVEHLYELSVNIINSQKYHPEENCFLFCAEIISKFGKCEEVINHLATKEIDVFWFMLWRYSNIDEKYEVFVNISICIFYLLKSKNYFPPVYSDIIFRHCFAKGCESKNVFIIKCLYYLSFFLNIRQNPCINLFIYFIDNYVKQKDNSEINPNFRITLNEIFTDILLYISKLEKDILNKLDIRNISDIPIQFNETQQIFKLNILDNSEVIPSSVQNELENLNFNILSIKEKAMAFKYLKKLKEEQSKIIDKQTLILYEETQSKDDNDLITKLRDEVISYKIMEDLPKNKLEIIDNNVTNNFKMNTKKLEILILLIRNAFKSHFEDIIWCYNSFFKILLPLLVRSNFPFIFKYQIIKIISELPNEMNVINLIQNTEYFYFHDQLQVLGILIYCKRLNMNFNDLIDPNFYKQYICIWNDEMQQFKLIQQSEIRNDLIKEFFQPFIDIEKIKEFVTDDGKSFFQWVLITLKYSLKNILGMIRLQRKNTKIENLDMYQRLIDPLFFLFNIHVLSHSSGFLPKKISLEIQELILIILYELSSTLKYREYILTKVESVDKLVPNILMSFGIHKNSYANLFIMKIFAIVDFEDKSKEELMNIPSEMKQSCISFIDEILKEYINNIYKMDDYIDLEFKNQNNKIEEFLELGKFMLEVLSNILDKFPLTSLELNLMLLNSNKLIQLFKEKYDIFQYISQSYQSPKLIIIGKLRKIFELILFGLSKPSDNRKTEGIFLSNIYNYYCSIAQKEFELSSQEIYSLCSIYYNFTMNLDSSFNSNTINEVSNSYIYLISKRKYCYLESLIVLIQSFIFICTLGNSLINLNSRKIVPHILIYVTSYYEVTYISQEKYSEKRYILSHEVARLLSLLNPFRDSELRSTKHFLIEIKNKAENFGKFNMNNKANFNTNSNNNINEQDDINKYSFESSNIENNDKLLLKLPEFYKYNYEKQYSHDLIKEGNQAYYKMEEEKLRKEYSKKIRETFKQ